MYTRDDFEEFKKDYKIYGTHTKSDKYLNESIVRDEEPKCVIHTMWHPLTDTSAIAEYGKNISKMFYCVMYEDCDVDYNDVVEIRGHEYEVVGIKYYNTHTRIDVSRKKA
jgi:hypothetical protein